MQHDDDTAFPSIEARTEMFEKISFQLSHPEEFNLDTDEIDAEYLDNMLNSFCLAEYDKESTDDDFHALGEFLVKKGEEMRREGEWHIANAERRLDEAQKLEREVFGDDR